MVAQALVSRRCAAYHLPFLNVPKARLAAPRIKLPHRLAFAAPGA